MKTEARARMRSFRVTGPSERQEAVLRLLAAEGYEFVPEPFSGRCFRLCAEPRPLGSSLAAFFGHIYIQDRSSMLPPLALAPETGSAVLDMCASPGSKTGFLADLTGQGGMVLANEPNPSRLATLRANMRQLDMLNVVSCSYPGAEIPLLDNSWQWILLDPPCSGWGTSAKNPQAQKIWQGKKIDQLVRIQRNLLKKAASLLAPGGRLLYSTCTTNPDENEIQAQFAIEELGLEIIPLQPFSGFSFLETRITGTLLVDEDASASQGFFIALLRKPETSESPVKDREDMFRSPPDVRNECVAAACDFSRLPPGYVAHFGEKARYVPVLAEKFLPASFRWQGALLGTVDRSGRFSPQPRLKSLVNEACALRLENLAEIRAFLNGSSVFCDKNTDAAALFYEDLPLGLIHCRKGRAISYFGNDR